MPTRKPAVLSFRAVQTTLFRPLSQSPPSWDRMPEAVKTRVVEALAQMLLRASGLVAELEEGGGDD